MLTRREEVWLRAYTAAITAVAGREPDSSPVCLVAANIAIKTMDDFVELFGVHGEHEDED